MACCCGRWWKASIYFITSVILAFIAISTRSNPNDSSSSTRTTHHELSLNASRAVRKAGFNFMANLLQISPELFLSSSNSSTIFVLKDSAFSYPSLPPWLLKDVLQYHTIPLNLPMSLLFNKSQGICLPTLYQKKKVAITKINPRKRLIKINHVQISHLNIFLAESFSIHGVSKPFTSLNPRIVRAGYEVIQEPTCDSNSSVVSDNVLESKNLVEWPLIIRFLNSHGFVSYAAGLHSVLQKILKDHTVLNSVTIFVPPRLELFPSSSSLLQSLVRFHIVPQRLTYKDLSSLSVGTSLKTLAFGQHLEVACSLKLKHGLVINGVKVIQPNMFSSHNFVVHGISRPFEVIKHS